MKKVQKQKKITLVVGYYLLGVLAGLLGVIAITRLIWHSKFYPNVVVGSVSVGGLSRAEAKVKIEEEISKTNLVLTYNGHKWSLTPNAITLNVEESLNRAYRVGRRLDLRDYALIFISREQIFPLVLGEGETEEYSRLYSEIAQAIEIPVVNAELGLVRGKVTFSNGSGGFIIDSSRLRELLGERMAKLDNSELEVPTKTVHAELREEEKTVLVERANKLIGKKLLLTIDDEKVKLADAELFSLLNTKPSSSEVVDRDRAVDYVSALAESLNRNPEDAKFEFVDGKVTEFAPSKDGLSIKVEETVDGLVNSLDDLIALEKKEIVVEIQALRTAPQVTMDKLNELGIKERIGRGESYYAHSIPNRVYNVGLAAERINTALVPPGEEVSFNKLVGEVSAATGYRSAYIISQGRTVLGDGGGLCQVSTTLFRAAMNAGLPILERWGHSYRVSYYEQNSKPGIDATVIAPSKDFRFKNDTPGHILIQTINDPKELHLVIEVYGTSDGRVATVTEPKVWGVTPPLPTIYQDDPSLPTGTMKQVDWATGGARTSFEYKVVRNGETLQDQTFSTVYRPWAAVYLRGTGSTPSL